VSLRDQGSHADMDAATFIASIASLRGYFHEMADAGSRGADFRALNEIGVAAERNMLIATGGVNTHRGAVFSLGLIAAGAGYVLERRLPRTADEVCDVVGRLWGADMLATLHQCEGTNGSAVRGRYGVPGAREHAAGGFGVLRKHALPAMRKAFSAGLDRNWSGVHSFLESIAVLDDTNLLHRGGPEALNFARDRARTILDAGGALTANGRHQARMLHSEFVAAWLSPGGSADMLAMCYFLHEFEAAFGG
jgi:triphosphoribosyl-dephospho-CoA synthase